MSGLQRAHVVPLCRQMEWRPLVAVLRYGPALHITPSSRHGPPVARSALTSPLLQQKVHGFSAARQDRKILRVRTNSHGTVPPPLQSKCTGIS